MDSENSYARWTISEKVNKSDHGLSVKSVCAWCFDVLAAQLQFTCSFGIYIIYFEVTIMAISMDTTIAEILDNPSFPPL